MFAQVIPLLDAMVQPGCIVLSDQKLPAVHWQSLPLPDGVADERYFMYRVGG
jgi:hypothetical protein